MKYYSIVAIDKTIIHKHIQCVVPKLVKEEPAAPDDHCCRSLSSPVGIHNTISGTLS